MSILYFAYGSNMDTVSFRKRYPAAVFCGTARLEDYSFIINSKGVATVKKDPGSVVYGVMWEITESDEKLLDEFEGIAEGLYRSRMLKVWSDKEAAFKEVKVYISDNIIPGFPLPGYMPAVIESAAAHNFPESYREHLNRQDEELFS